MVCKVTLYKAGKVWDEEVIAIDYQDAKQVALARNEPLVFINKTFIGIQQQ